VDTLKVADVAPAAIMTVAGVVALEVPDDRFTDVPPGPAGPFKVAVAVEALPPVTVVGATVMLLMVAGLIVRFALTDVLPTVAETDVGVTLETGDVATVKVAEVAPAATVTFVGGTVLELFDARLTTRPPFGAATLSVTVPVEDVPPKRTFGASVSRIGYGGKTCKTVVTEVWATVALMVPFVMAPTVLVLIVNVA
jgi:hypothetical protein